jgi:hypothetical protein
MHGRDNIVNFHPLHSLDTALPSQCPQPLGRPRAPTTAASGEAAVRIHRRRLFRRCPPPKKHTLTRCSAQRPCPRLHPPRAQVPANLLDTHPNPQRLLCWAPST